MTVHWDDKIVIIKQETSEYTPETKTLGEVRELINDMPNGPKEVIIDVTLDFNGNESESMTVGIIPAGSVVKYAAMLVTTTVVGGSTTVKLGLGPAGGDVDQFGLSGALTAATATKSCYTVLLTSQTTISVNGVVTNGSALGDTDLTAGVVRVVMVYDTPNTLA